MFKSTDKDFVEMSLSTTRFLGRQHTGEEFLNLLSRYDGIYVPEKWDTEEKTTRAFDRSSSSDVLRVWTAPEKTQYLFFDRKRPVETQMFLRIRRFARAKFNDFSTNLRDGYLEGSDRIQEFLTFTAEVCTILSADHCYISHIVPSQRQFSSMTLAERLPGIYWANFFGRPYIDFFGREKLLAAPCHEAREIGDDLILLLTADSPYRGELFENDEVARRLKQYLNQNAFPGPNFPGEPCSVPQFDFSDVRDGAIPTEHEGPAEKIRRIRSDLEARGYQLLSDSEGRLTFRGSDGTIVAIDVITASVSVDTTGTLLEKPDGSH